MIYTDFIAAIDLGTSHMVGMVGTKNASGALTIVAYEVEKSEMSMRRGCVYNVEDTAYKINALLKKLENKLDGAKIAKVYIGLGGYSIRTVDHLVSKVLGAEMEVTESVLNALHEECCSYHPSKLDVLGISAPVYFLDGREESAPLGIACSRIEARYKLIVARPLLRRSIEKTIAERIKREIPQVLVSPVALADLVLTDREKEQGGILIDFGAGVTSVSAYKHGKLQMLYVLPFGSHLITRDIMSLRVSDVEAERLKRTYGNAQINREDEQQPIGVNRLDESGMHEMKLIDLNEIVEARAREIIENVYARLADEGITKEPNYTVVITGGGANLKNMREAVSARFNMEVRYASIRRDFIESGEMIANNPEYTMAAALLLAGKENCAFRQPEPVFVKPEPVKAKEPVREPVKEPVAPEPVAVEPEKPKPEPKVEPEPVEEPVAEPKVANKKSAGKKSKDRGLFDGLWDGIRGKFEKMTSIDDNDY